jgi:NAD(P)-dependent dehydrogenase (short-subunit alcohol dehydrogenase family)
MRRRTLESGDLRRQLEGTIAAGRLGRPKDVAGVVVAAYVTGSAYYVDSGMTNWNKGL